MDIRPVIETVCAGDSIYLSGNISLSSGSAEAMTQGHFNLVVIVDDNSGSMGSYFRDKYCILKTEALIEGCGTNTPYCYSTFGSQIIHRGRCAASDVKKYLISNEGTQMLLLAKGAIQAARQVISEARLTPDSQFRLVFVLNTDGEAADGELAGNLFKTEFQKLREEWPNMAEARTFMLGIGNNHDQRVLGAMSVGEASYFNYPDADLERMPVDTVANIIPEINGSKMSVTLQFNSGRAVDVRVAMDAVDVSEIRVYEGETSVTFPDGSIYAINTTPQILLPGQGRYFDIQIRDLEKRALELARDINSIVGNGDPSNMARADEYESVRLNLVSYRSELLQQVISHENGGVSKIPDVPLDPDSLEKSISDTLAGPAPLGAAMPPAGVGVEGRRSVYTMLLQLRQVALNKTKPDVADSSALSPEQERLNALGEVLNLCFNGLKFMRVGGKLSNEIERDYMELLGSGGFKHWTGKKKARLVDRALEQANASADVEADKKVLQLLNNNSLGQSAPVTGPATSLLCRISNYVLWGHSMGQAEATKSNSCWFTLLTDAQLADQGDVLCIGAYIPPGRRNLPLCSVSSALVLNRMILDGDIVVCPFPMSFMSLRGLLQGGHQVARGPHGLPINSVLCLLPTPSLSLSCAIAKAYEALATSQLLTTRWVYTVGTSEYRNGMLAAIASIAASRPGLGLSVPSSDKDALISCLMGFSVTYAGSHYMNSVVNRAKGFLNFQSTSGDVSTFSVAIADQMIAYLHQFNSAGTDLIQSYAAKRQVFWRALLLRVLRDLFSDVFTAFVAPTDPDGDKLRRDKAVQAEAFLEVMTQGLNFPESEESGPDLNSVTAFVKEIGYIFSEPPTSGGGVDLSSISLVDTTINNEEEEDCGFDTFFDAYEMDADVIAGGAAAATASPVDEVNDAKNRICSDSLWFNNSSENCSTTSPRLYKDAAAGSTMRLKDVVKTVLEWRDRLGVRSGAPSKVKSDADVLAAGMGGDWTRLAVLNKVMDCIQREVEIFVRADIHMRFQESFFNELMGRETINDTRNKMTDLRSALADMLGFEMDSSEGIKWILSQVLLAVELRYNSKYRVDAEESSTASVSAFAESDNAGEDVPDEGGKSGLLRLDSEAVLLRLNSRFAKRQKSVWDAEEAARLAKFKNILKRLFLQHPSHFAPLPLMIYSNEHRHRISAWTSAHRGFDIMQAVSPLTDEPTGMASNTYICKHSRYFMKKVSPYVAITEIFGSGDERDHTIFCEHLHTFAFKTYLSTSVGENNGAKSFYEFERVLHDRYGADCAPHRSVLLVWVHCAFKHSLHETTMGSISTAEDILLQKSSFNATEEDRLLIHEEIVSNVKWIVNPSEYLDAYFSSDECHPKCVISLSEFTKYCRDKKAIPTEAEMRANIEVCNEVESALQVVYDALVAEL